MSEWKNRTITDEMGTAGRGSVVLSEELADWLDAEYELDEDDEAWLMDVLTGTEISGEDSETLIGGFGIRVEFDSEWSAERSAESIYERLAPEGATLSDSGAVTLGVVSLTLGDDRGESGDEALAGAWWRCTDGEFGWVWDAADIEIAAEYLRAVASEN